MRLNTLVSITLSALLFSCANAFASTGTSAFYPDFTFGLGHNVELDLQIHTKGYDIPGAGIRSGDPIRIQSRFVQVSDHQESSENPAVCISKVGEPTSSNPESLASSVTFKLPIPQDVSESLGVPSSDTLSVQVNFKTDFVYEDTIYTAEIDVIDSSGKVISISKQDNERVPGTYSSLGDEASSLGAPVLACK